ncbi:hypothetical protein M433DRAFT_143127 [Acidomyces richmondensis BFW]|nr:MAG: hypothetical protein FE78DRAFT_78929 [Acidomyces sp. 'richmondensis']KYG46299.1 hypothetical protein M433DRAFT_143127 [Acidomyces richmondensis BFW]
MSACHQQHNTFTATPSAPQDASRRGSGWPVDPDTAPSPSIAQPLLFPLAQFGHPEYAALRMHGHDDAASALVPASRIGARSAVS